ncbi:MAG TPA: DUF2867 domain-containing protein [Mycobacteriales bacterium]|nr:DUF2867 domain-containing protein [Mycobacteriales bacterium]
MTQRVDERVRVVDATPADLWQVIADFGGANRWYAPPLVWELRGLLDRLMGGIGLRRGRPSSLAAGDALDFWRVEELRPGALLRLRAEMRTPGTVRLELRAEPADGGRARYRQRVLFQPAGVPGELYWWALRPADTLLYRFMVRTAAAAASRRHEGAPEPRNTA